jgi:hypothetical protein
VVPETLRAVAGCDHYAIPTLDEVRIEILAEDAICIRTEIGT